VRADDPATLDANLAALVGVSVLDLEEKEAPQDAVKIEAALRWLDAHPTWLMILDNVDDGEAVKAVTKLMARLKGGHVIVTARAATFPAALRKLELDVLDEDAAAEFLLERTRDDRARADDDADKARAIACELDGLALGLEHAGAYIATLRIGFAGYLKRWRIAAHEQRPERMKGRLRGWRAGGSSREPGNATVSERAGVVVDAWPRPESAPVPLALQPARGRP